MKQVYKVAAGYGTISEYADLAAFEVDVGATHSNGDFYYDLSVQSYQVYCNGTWISQAAFNSWLASPSFSSVPTLPVQALGTFFAGPVTGPDAAPGFRTITSTDISAAETDPVFASWRASAINLTAGYLAGSAMTTATGNAIYGASAGVALVDGTNNLAAGTGCLSGLISGSGNIGIGYQAGTLETGSNTLYLGNILQISQANERAYSMMYGTFSGSAASLVGQTLRVNGSLICGGGLATSATEGFLYVPSCAGMPAGTPTGQTGTIPLIYDRTNSLLYLYNSSSWNLVGGGGGFTIFEADGQIETPIAKTYYIMLYTKCAGSINNITYQTGANSLTFGVFINGVGVTSLTGLTASSVQATVSATGTDTFTAGQPITIVVSAISAPAPTDFAFSVQYTRTA